MTALLPLFLLGCFDGAAPLHPDDAAEVVVDVPKGATANSLHAELVSLGVAPDGFGWKMWVRNHPTEVNCLKAGKHAIRKNMSLEQVFVELCGVPLADDVPFTVLEGWRIREIDEALAQAGLIQPGAYKAIAESKAVNLPFPIEGANLEGYLWPETYMVSPTRFDPKVFIERQLNTFADKFYKAHPDGFGKRGLQAVVVMASMLEREEPSPKNRPTVAGILWKRIDNAWNLGVDATSRYTLADWNDRGAFLKNLRNPDEPYNTRLKGGLPPTPIGNPSLESLEAALSPVESEYWYYLHDSQGVFHPARNVEEHEAFRKKYNVY